MPTYAAKTEVSSDRSIAEIERTVDRYGATEFAYGRNGQRGIIGFVMKGRQIRFTVPLPDREGPTFTRSPTGRQRAATAAQEAYQQAVRQRWRALALVVKAKLEAVETGIVTFDEEFGMAFVLPDGRTVAEHVLPVIEQAYQLGHVPPMLAIGTASTGSKDA